MAARMCSSKRRIEGERGATIWSASTVALFGERQEQFVGALDGSGEGAVVYGPGAVGVGFEVVHGEP